MALVAEMGVAAVQNVGDIAFIETGAKAIGVTASKSEVEHGCRKLVELDELIGTIQGGGSHDGGADPFQRADDVQRNEELVLDDEDRAPSEAGALHGISWRRQLGAITKGAGSPRKGDQGPKPSINPQRARNTRTDRLP
jgi:hypothetical protein